MRLFRIFFSLKVVFSLLLSCFIGLPIYAVEPSASVATSADEIFSALSESLFQIRIVEKKSGALSSAGSGFVVDENRIVTNFHVISSAILEAEKYKIEIKVDGLLHEMEFLSFDVVNDIALLRFKEALEKKLTPFKLAVEIPRKGQMLYSLGNPHSLGMIIIEGNYNGLADKKYLDQIHFSGSLNPGMSGGPAVNARSEVVGVNVSTAGNQVSFLIPVKALSELMNKEWLASEKDVFSELSHQIGNFTDNLIHDFLNREWRKENLGEAIVLGEIADWFSCWGDSELDEQFKILEITRSCRSSDSIYISSGMSVGRFHYEFVYAEANDMLPTAFYRYWRKRTANLTASNRAQKEYLENFKCTTQVVSSDKSQLNLNIRRRVSFCVRPYKKIAGIYDVVFVGASLDRNDRAVMDHFALSGVRKETAQRFLSQFMEVVAWQ